MSYTPTNWQTGDTITASLLNKMEQGIASAGGGGVLVVTDTEGTLDKTWKEISDAGYAVLRDSTNHLFPLYFLVSQGGMYGCVFLKIQETTPSEIVYVATAEDGYPSLMDGGGN